MEKNVWLDHQVFIKGNGMVKRWKVAGFLPNGQAILVNTDGSIHGAVSLDRLELVPTPPNDGYLSATGFRASPDEATEWFVFVMLQAADLFERMPGDAWPEVTRLLEARGQHANDPVMLGAKAYFDAVTKFYKEDEE